MFPVCFDKTTAAKTICVEVRFLFLKKELSSVVHAACICLLLKLMLRSERIPGLTEQLFYRFSPHPTSQIHPTLPPLGLEEITFPYVFSVSSS